jgi:exodeoxyribonuclease V alpha subunit
MDAWLIALMRAGALRAVDAHFAALMARLSAQPDADGAAGAALASPAAAQPARSAAVTLAAALVSAHAGEGHSCLPLARAAGGEAFPTVPGVAPQAPALPVWRAALHASGVAGAPQTQADAPTPLVLDGADRLYLHRHWRDEARVAQRLCALAAPRADADPGAVRAVLGALFPGDDGGATGQRRAAAIAALHSLAVISGGPGTGKTTTVRRLLAALIALAGQGAAPRILLAAPTGKAAARLAQVMGEAPPHDPVPENLRACLPTVAATVHRLLGYQPHSGRFRHDAQNPLGCEVLVVDEASMVDLALMARLLDALPSGARLVLLGDRDQLASVDAGAVLGDICTRPGGGYSAAAAARLQAATGDAAPATGPGGVGDAIALLEHSYRFAGGSGIGRLASAVRTGDVAAAIALLHQPPPGVSWDQPADAAALFARLAPWTVAVYADLADARDPGAALAVIERVRVLAALREGPWGAAGLNRAIEHTLRRRGVLRGDGALCAGRPLLITRNAPDLGLYNGDLGVLFPDPADGGALRAWFRGADGTPRPLAPARLPAHETAFAMTVHKAQGSECEIAMLVLPPGETPTATRELVYTALTRARVRLTLWAREEALRGALARRARRDSGLQDALTCGPRCEATPS